MLAPKRVLFFYLSIESGTKAWNFMSHCELAKAPVRTHLFHALVLPFRYNYCAFAVPFVCLSSSRPSFFACFLPGFLASFLSCLFEVVFHLRCSVFLFYFFLSAFLSFLKLFLACFMYSFPCCCYFCSYFLLFVFRRSCCLDVARLLLRNRLFTSFLRVACTWCRRQHLFFGFELRVRHYSRMLHYTLLSKTLSRSWHALFAIATKCPLWMSQCTQLN